jgi:hypothetical protein
MCAGMKLVGGFVVSVLVTFGLWILVACVDHPFPETPPAARVVTAWDPLECGEPHRVAVELEDHDGGLVSGSVPCARGSIALDVPHFGTYRGRVYAWELDEPIRSILPVQLVVDEAIVRWLVMTPR